MQIMMHICGSPSRLVQLPSRATKKTHKMIRNLYKRISLGVLYGLTAYGASGQLQNLSSKPKTSLINIRFLSCILGLV